MDWMFFFRCVETALFIMGMNAVMISLRQPSAFRLILSGFIIFLSCVGLTLIYQTLGVEAAKKIFGPMIFIILGGLVLFNSAETFWRTYFVFATQYLIYGAISSACVLTYHLLFESNVLFYLLIQGIAFGIIVILQYHFFRSSFRNITQITDSEWRLISMVVTMFALLIALQSIYPVIYYERPFFDLFEMLMTYVLFFLVLFYIYATLLNMTNKHEFERTRAEMIEKTKFLEHYKHLSEIDPLTGLLNRRAFQEKVEEYFSTGNSAYLMFMDIDHFKLINDQFGHEVGDEVLKKIALALQTVFRNTDLITRFGGDEFIVLVRCMDHDTDKIELKVDAFNKKLAELIETAQLIPDISVSTGISYLKNRENLKEFYKVADRAMYKAKQSGGGQTVFDPVGNNSNLTDDVGFDQRDTWRGETLAMELGKCH